MAAGGLVATPAGGFTWTRAGGRTDYGQLPGMPGSSHAFAISSDGQTTAGMTTNTAYRYRAGDPALQLLGIQPGYTSSKAQGISGDGEIVVGMSRAGQTDEFAEAFRWTSTTGLVGLGYLQPGQSYSEAAAVSSDGAVVVGHVRQTTGFNQAFVWREGTGMVGLPGLDLVTNSGRASAVNQGGGSSLGAVSSDSPSMQRCGSAGRPFRSECPPASSEAGHSA